MRAVFRLFLVAAGLFLTAVGGAQAQQGCLVQQAADSAVQRQIAMIDAAKVNPSDFFSGANSCIAPQLLQRVDLSNMIPSMQNFLSDAAMSAVNGMIQQAQSKLCSALNSQLSQLVGKLNSVGGEFQSQLGGELGSILGGSNSFTQISLPAINGLGSYDLQSQTGGSLINASNPGSGMQSPSGGVIQPRIPSGSLTQPGGSNFGTIFQ